MTHTNLLIFFIVACILVSTGCISQNPSRDTSGTRGTNIPVSTAAPTPVLPHPIVNSSFYITLNPVGTHHIGDVFEINGTSNLPVGSEIRIRIFSSNIHTMPTGISQTTTLAPTPAFHGVAKIRNGGHGENIWSIQANISGLTANVSSYVGLSATDPGNYVINETDIGVFLPEVERISGDDIAPAMDHQPTISPIVTSATKPGPDTDVSNPAKPFRLNGTITYIDLEGGFYGIITENKSHYLPLNLEDRYKKDGMKITFEAVPRPGVYTIFMWGKTIEIVSIDPV